MSDEELQFTKKTLLKAKEMMDAWPDGKEVATALRNVEKGLIKVKRELGEEDEYVDEYQQVAAILALDIDTLATVAENDEFDADFLRVMIVRLKRNKDLAISDAKVRESRYNAINMIFNVASKNETS